MVAVNGALRYDLPIRTISEDMWIPEIQQSLLKLQTPGLSTQLIDEHFQLLEQTMPARRSDRDWVAILLTPLAVAIFGGLSLFVITDMKTDIREGNSRLLTLSEKIATLQTTTAERIGRLQTALVQAASDTRQLVTDIKIDLTAVKSEVSAIHSEIKATNAPPAANAPPATNVPSRGRSAPR
jgi:hypothetical protein